MWFSERYKYCSKGNQNRNIKEKGIKEYQIIGEAI